MENFISLSSLKDKKMSKNKLVNTVALIVLNIFVVSAQVDKCGTKIYIEYKKSQDPSYIKDLEAADKLIDSFIKSSQRASSNSGGQTVLRIPVVAHVLYKTSQQNISDAQIIFSFKLFGIFVNISNKNPHQLKAGGTL